jgi:hypothetical protein
MDTEPEGAHAEVVGTDSCAPVSKFPEDDRIAMKTSKFALVAAVLGAVWLAGCSTIDSRINQYPDTFAQLTPQQQALVRAGQVGLGFDMTTVKIALGDPDRVVVRTDASGDVQIWHYGEYAYYNGVYLWAGDGYRRRAWWGGGGWWGPGPGPYWDTPVQAFDRFRVEFRNGRVVSIQRDTGY